MNKNLPRGTGKRPLYKAREIIGISAAEEEIIGYSIYKEQIPAVIEKLWHEIYALWPHDPVLNNDEMRRVAVGLLKSIGIINNVTRKINKHNNLE